MAQLSDFSRNLIDAAQGIAQIGYSPEHPHKREQDGVLTWIDAFDAPVTFEPVDAPRYRIHDLSLLVRFAATFSEPQDLADLARPGQITCLALPETDHRLMLELAASALGLWFAPLEHPDLARLAVLRAAQEESKLILSITSKLERGGGGVLLLTYSGAPACLRPLLDTALRLAPLSPAVIAAMLQHTHGADPLELDLDALASLDLSPLSPLALVRAFAESTPQEVIARLAALAQPKPDGAPRLTLERVHGLTDVRPALKCMARDLARWQAGTLDWKTATTSALLYGPPGTGKSMAAAALASSADVPLVLLTYGDAQKAGHLGDTMREMSCAFEAAMQAAPAVLFLEEIDGFGSRESLEDHNNSYRRAVVTHLLQLLDAAQTVPGLVILGCTNHIDAIDPAVRRAGRFDLTLRIGLPDRRALLAILRDLLPDARVDLAPMADRLIGHSGADAAAAAREAQSLARDAEEPVSERHLHAALDRIAPRIAPEVLKRMALHEAGHLLVAHLLRQPAPERAVLSSTGTYIDLPLPPVQTFSTAQARLRVLLAGRAAEIAVFGAPSAGAGNGPDSDLALATGLALTLELQWGMGDCGLIYAPVTEATRVPAWLHAKLRGLLDEAQAEALSLLRQNRAALQRIADALLAERELDAPALALLMPAVSPEPKREVANDNVISFSPRRAAHDTAQSSAPK